MKRRSFFGHLLALVAAPSIINALPVESKAEQEPVKIKEPKWVKITPRRGRVMVTHLGHAKELYPGVSFSYLPKYVTIEGALFRIEEELNVSNKLVTIGFAD